MRRWKKSGYDEFTVMRAKTEELDKAIRRDGVSAITVKGQEAEVLTVSEKV